MPRLSPSPPVKVTPRARREIRQASRWWAENRTKAPHAFREDVQRAFETLARQPRIGSPATNEKLAGVRRLHLKRIRYYLYYRVKGDPKRVEILALWHASRRTGPGLE